MLEKFHAYITVVTTVHTLSLPQATWINFIPSKVFSLTYVLTLSSHVCTCFLPYTCHMPCPSFFLDLITLITYSEQYKSWISLLCIFLQPPATSSLLSTNISLSTIVLPTPHPYSSFRLRDYISCPDKTMRKMVVLFILSSVSYILGLFPLSQHATFWKLPVTLNTWCLLEYFCF